MVNRNNPGQHPAIVNKVLILSGVRGDTRRYRTIHPYQQLSLAGMPAALSHLTAARLPDMVDQAQVVIFHRAPWDAYLESLIQRIEKHGGLALMDTDDLTFDSAAFAWIDSPDFQDPVRAELYQEDMRRNQKTLQRCSGVLTSTEYLADQVTDLGKPAWIHRNAFSLEMLSLSRLAAHQRTPHPEMVVLGYASGTPTHDRDFEIVRPVLQQLLARKPETELWVVGPLDPGHGWQDFGDRIRRIPLQSWRALPAVLAQFDINLAPLAADNPFAQSKSEIKYMEAALVGVPTIATPTGAFQQAIRNQENGLLAVDPSDWAQQLERLSADVDFRVQLGTAAREAVLKEYHPCLRANQLVATLNDIYLQLRGQPLWDLPEGWHMPYDEPGLTPGMNEREMEAHPTYLEMAGYTLRHRGLGTLLRQIWIFFRRAAAPLFPYRHSQVNPKGD